MEGYVKMEITLLANIAMSLLVLGSVPSIISAIRNRNNLYGFSTIGALIILIGQTMYSAYFLVLQDYVTVLLSVPLMFYWGFIVIFSNKNRVFKEG